MLRYVVYIVIRTKPRSEEREVIKMRDWLRGIRTEAGFTQEYVAERAGIARATYGHIESGERGVTVANAKKISKVLGFHWTIFFEDESHELKNGQRVI